MSRLFGLFFIWYGVGGVNDGIDVMMWCGVNDFSSINIVEDFGLLL